MSKIKRTLLYSLLMSSLAIMPVSVFAMGGEHHGDSPVVTPKTEEKADDQQLPKVEKARGRFNFGVYYGRPYYYRPYYYYYPYRPHYNRYYYNRPYYRW